MIDPIPQHGFAMFCLAGYLIFHIWEEEIISIVSAFHPENRDDPNRLSIFGVGPTTIKDPYFLDGVDSNQRKVQPYSGKSDFLPSLATADLRCWPADFMATTHNFVRFIELDDGKIETGPPYILW